MPAGTLLRRGDMAWEEVPQFVVGADIVRGSASETDFLGAATRRAFAAREPLTTAELAKPGDREFLVAALGASFRAVSINVDAVQSTAGLVLPGDRVDVILTQTFGAQIADVAHRTVGETVLRDLRVIAVDQTLGPSSKPIHVRNTLGEVHMPKTVTLEVTERQGSDTPGGRSTRQGPACPARTAGSEPGASADSPADAGPDIADMGSRCIESLGGSAAGRDFRDGACGNRYHAWQQDRASVRELANGLAPCK